MVASIIDGKALAKQVQHRLSSEVLLVRNKLGRSPHLAVVLVGENPASKVYVRSKTKRAKDCGIDATDVNLPEDISNEQLQSQLCSLSKESCLDGILLQLPLPVHLDEYAALLAISPDKDVDGLHPMNQGLLMRGRDALRPCTPLGCMMLIQQACKQLGRVEDISGANAVVIGRSILVGRPLAILLQHSNCTVTMCHSRTRDLSAECRRADIIIAAVGQQGLVKSNFVREGAIVIDVGINHDREGRLIGDVDFDDVVKVAGAITPVPGGVGPMTIAMLLSNTVESAKRKIKV